MREEAQAEEEEESLDARCCCLEQSHVHTQ